MCLKVFLLLTLVPVLEIAVLISLGTRIGIWPTVLLLIVMGMVGATVAKWQGVETLREIQRQTSQGKMPADKLLDGLIIFIAGMLLALPGFVTDIMALCLLVPPIRRMVLRYVGSNIRAKLAVRVQVNGQTYTSVASTDPLDTTTQTPPDVIDAEFVRRNIE